MTDDEKEKNTPEDHHDEFEEEFAFDSDVTDSDDFLEEPQDETEAGTETQPAAGAKPKGSVLPLLIGLVILCFIGWKGYRYFFPKLPSIENAQITPVPDSTVPASPDNAPIKLPNQEIPQGLSAQGFNNQGSTVPPASAPTPTTPPPTSGLLPSPVPVPASPTTPTTPTTPPHSSTSSNVLPSTSSSIALPPQKNEKPSTIPSLDQAPLSQAPKTAAPQTSTSTGSHHPQAESHPPSRAEIQAPLSAQDTLSKLEQKIEEQERVYKQQIQILEKDLANISQNSANTHKGIDSLQNDVGNLSNAVRSLTEQIKSLKQAPKRKESKKADIPKKQSTTARTEANPSLCVYAIIPGRAWLKTSSGKTITVSEGDTIAEFGTVLKIDAGNALVVTSSGIVLR